MFGGLFGNWRQPRSSGVDFLRRQAKHRYPEPPYQAIIMRVGIEASIIGSILYSLNSRTVGNQARRICDTLSPSFQPRTSTPFVQYWR